MTKDMALPAGETAAIRAIRDLRERGLVTKGQLLGLGHFEAERLTAPTPPAQP